MNRDLIYFTLALAALYLVFDQFAGNKNLSKLAESLWQGGSTTATATTAQDEKTAELLDIMATAGNIRY